ncbi:MAG: hypothetical protein NTX59_01570, partial [Elusimicrobia bacterium]|nr:hypothetical protein [Elusimicrobiota bacterium]
MLLKMSKIALFPLILFACLAGIAHAADITTHVFGAKKQALDPAGNTMPAGYYVLKNLSDVDTDLVPGNIAVSTTIFGVLGTYTSDGTAATGDIAIGKIAYANGVKLTGSVPAGANVTGVAGSSVVTITDGLYSGNKTATVNDTLLSAGNIKTGVTIFATAGT